MPKALGAWLSDSTLQGVYYFLLMCLVSDEAFTNAVLLVR